MRVVNVATGKWLMATMITQDWLSKAPVSVLVLYNNNNKKRENVISIISETSVVAKWETASSVYRTFHLRTDK